MLGIFFIFVKVVLVHSRRMLVLELQNNFLHALCISFIFLKIKQSVSLLFCLLFFALIMLWNYIVSRYKFLVRLKVVIRIYVNNFWLRLVFINSKLLYYLILLIRIFFYEVLDNLKLNVVKLTSEF